MGDNLNAFLALTDQYAKDIQTVYESYQEEKQDIAVGLIDAALKPAYEELKGVRSEHMDQMMSLTKTYLENIKTLPQGEHPEQQKKK